jgi:hypothetical protein
MNLAHALLVAAPRATPGREVPPAGDVLDRFIGVVRLLAPMLNAQLMAELEAAGMPPFIQPADSPANLEAFRWLLVAVQAYHSARWTTASPPPVRPLRSLTAAPAHGPAQLPHLRRLTTGGVRHAIVADPAG